MICLLHRRIEAFEWYHMRFLNVDLAHGTSKHCSFLILFKFVCFNLFLEAALTKQMATKREFDWISRDSMANRARETVGKF